MKQSNKQLISVKKYQSGAALLIAVVLLASMAAFYIMGQFGAVSNKQSRESGRIAVLAEAKQALISYAVTYIDSKPGEMGFLPCPDYQIPGSAVEGEEDLLCNNAQYQSTLGRLPWKTLGLPPLKDNANECLWYVVSGSYKNTNNPDVKADLLNIDTTGLFQVFDKNDNLVAGATAEDRIVAAIIAPGSPLAGQDRSAENGGVGVEFCGGNYVASNYLEGTAINNNSDVSGADTIDGLMQAAAGSNELATPFNDRIITISRNEIWNAIKRRNTYGTGATQIFGDLTKKVADCVVAYGNDIPGQPSYLPWPAEVNLTGGDYRDEASYVDVVPVSGLLGRLADDVSNSQIALQSNSYTTGGPPGSATCKKSCQDAFKTCRDACPNGNPGKTCRDNCKTDRDSCNAACPSGGTTVSAVPKSINNVITECLLPGSADHKMWQNWKDHFFYVVSGSYAPDSPDVSCSSGSGCVTVNGNPTQYAGLVIFAHEASAGQLRRATPDADTKQFISNYLEGGNAGNYQDDDGDKNYESTAGNDLLYCISEGPPLVAAPCP